MLGSSESRMDPLPPAMEAALLKRLELHQVWPCFAASKKKIGRLGSRVKGFWESH